MLKKMFEKANRSQDPKNRTTPPGRSFFRTLRILRLRSQNPKNPKDSKKRTTASKTHQKSCTTSQGMLWNRME